MGQNFIACDREQVFLMPPDVREWLPESHLAWFVIDAVEELDLASFYRAYRADGHGRPAYEPAMMVALLLYAYARGIRSSRVIERGCEGDVAFRVIAAQQRPDHATIARFVERHADALAGLFGAVLGLCARAGLARVGVLAIDGTKVLANASRDANVDYEQIAREIVEEAQAVDAAEDEAYGEARGDELPPELTSSQGRRKWLREAQRELDRQREQQARPVPRSRPARLKEAKRRLDEQLLTECRVAEYQALIEGLKLARSRGIQRLRVFLDSELVVDQVNGRAKGSQGAHQIPARRSVLHAAGVSQHQGFVGPPKMECRSGRTCHQSASWSLSGTVHTDSARE